ncbi:hypothetical protein BASA62_003419 [Batrachochytrium salamandrivorans]|nr:hypothetical protein BASA62_003419 [Batrachochytrium salamandrivorans]
MLVWRRFLVQIPKLQRKFLLRRPKMFVGRPPRKKVLGDAPIPLPVGKCPGCSSPTWGVVRSGQGPKGSSRLLVRGASSNTSSVYSGEQSGFRNLGDGVVIIVTVVHGQIATTAQKMPDEEEEDKKVELPSKRPHVEGDAAAAPKSTAVLAIEANIADLVLKVAALETKLTNAEAEVATYSEQHEIEKLQLGGAKLAVPVVTVPIVEVVDKELAKVTWPLQKDVKLLPPGFVKDYMHVRNAKFVAAPSKPDQPSMLFHRLGDKKFVTGKRLIDFHATRDKQKCTVLLAPSGAGKTRNLFELLNEVLGFFIPYKLDNDKNYGSEALSAVLKLLQADPTMSWESTPPNYQANDKRAKFAIYCVLIAFTEVYRGLEKSFKAPPTPSQWLLIQLFPTQFLNEDVFAKLATSLYEHCDPKAVLEYESFRKDFYCVIDEAQVLGKVLAGKFLTNTPGMRSSNGLRPVLSPILHGVKVALGRLPVIAGSGLTLLEEWKSVLSTMGVEQDFIFTDFPLLAREQVLDLLRAFLTVPDDKYAEHVATWLVGRPRWVAEFISRVLVRNARMEPCFDEYLTWLTRGGSGENGEEPRTLLGAFNRLALKLNAVPSLDLDVGVASPYQDALLDAYLLSMDAPIKPRTSYALLEFGLGFPAKGDALKVELRYEPLVLETARWLTEDNAKLQKEVLRRVSDDAASLGKRFEYVSAKALLKSFTSCTMEEHPWSKGNPLPEAFKGQWHAKSAENLYGKHARVTKAERDFYLLHHKSIHFPDNFAGPDTILTLTKPDSDVVLTVFIQDKVTQVLKLKDALLTVDPAKLHHNHRGGPEEIVRPGVKSEQEKYLKSLTGPVIRVVVSVLGKIASSQKRFRLVPNCHGTKDVLLLVDYQNAESVYGKELWDYIRTLRDVGPV